MQKPDLIKFVPGTKAKATEVNQNFEELSDYVLLSAQELKAYVQTAVANVNLQLSQNIFTGKIEMYSGSTKNIPVGYLLCDGQEIDREKYNNLFNVIGTTYGTGNGVTTFNIPNLVARFPEGGTEAGIVKEAGLPEHYHFVASTIGGNNLPGLNTNNHLASYNGDTGNGWASYSLRGTAEKATTGKTSVTKGFDVADTVQPPSVTMLYIIKT